ncbi:MAG: hypothetical protein Q9217_000730 [Psora testacea]
MAPSPIRPDYSQWSNEELIKRVTSLEAQLKDQNAKYTSKVATSFRAPKAPRAFDPSRYETRFVALKFAYLGQSYNGLEYHPNNTTPLPTVEEELWKALHKARLILPTPNASIEEGEPNLEGCEYSKCGRTDRGVSAFGQVVGIRLRSNKPLTELPKVSTMDEAEVGRMEPSNQPDGIASRGHTWGISDGASSTPHSTTSSDPAAQKFHPIHDELPYPRILNRLLPPDIRVLAWCPNPPPDFSARHSCKERRYKYFFTNPAFTPTAGSAASIMNQALSINTTRREGWLGIDSMQEAAAKFVGLHDFRNFCKVDPSKQIDNFERRIFHAKIEEVAPHEQSAGYMGLPDFAQCNLGSTEPDSQSPAGGRSVDVPKLYAFTLHGSAFLWHQVRHMMAILFLIGQGLEQPSLIDQLLDVRSNPCKPMYEMANDAPLVLWDCIFPAEGSGSREDALEWIYVGDEPGREGNSNKTNARDAKPDMDGLVPNLWKVWRQRKIDEVLAGTLLNLTVRKGRKGDSSPRPESWRGRGSQKVFCGGNTFKLAGKYVPILEKPRMESVKVINERYARKKGGVDVVEQT